MASFGYEACSISELGDYVQFAGTARNLSTVRVGMVSWAENGAGYNDPNLVSNANGWQQPLMFSIYSVNTSGAQPTVGSLLATKTQTFTLPWAPGDGTHPYSAVTFDFSGDNITLPGQVIFGLAYNTGNYGANPTGYNGPYNSLNLGAYNGSPFVGTDAAPGLGFVNSTWSGEYGSGTYGVFAISDGGGDFSSGYQPSVEFNASPEPATLALLGLGGLVALVRRRRGRK
jgi:hypothetical protein